MFRLSLLLVALSAPTETPEPERVTTVANVERLPLAAPVNKVVLSVDSLAMNLTLTTTADARAIQQRLLAANPQLCPFIDRIGNAVIVSCRTPRIEARLDPNGGRPVLEIREVRGLPLSEDGDQIWFFYHPIALRLGSGCPGDTPASRGECHFKAGRFSEAAIEYRKALPGEHRRLAELRLGDISLRTGDPATAAGWYRMAGRYGSYGRMATARLCELGGTCLGELRKRTFDASLLPEPLHSEMLLRSARAAAYVGAVKESMTALLEAMRADSHMCDNETRVLCRRLVLFALKFPDRDGAPETLEAYLGLPSRTEGFLAIEMVRAAAEKALDQGAALFGANLLAASVPWVEALDTEALSDHMLRASEMYLAAKDVARARTLYEYADGRIGRRRMTGPRWAAVTSAVGGIDPRARRESDNAINQAARELAEAYTTLSRSLRFRQSQTQPTDSE
jgi:tetratricopeptide (TPR) repeat protein